MTDRMENPAYLAVAALADDDPQLCATATLGWIEADDVNVGRRGPAVIQVDALAQGFHVPRARVACDYHEVLLGDLVTRMREAKGELAVVREDQKAGCVGIEPADRKKTVAREA